MADVLLPLAWNGSTLVIPQASPTQDGYLSRDAFVLFSEGVAMAVSSFNTRTGEVILLDDDVMAALGYVPLDKHGDTMTGPLTLVPPTLPLHAATRAYVDAHAGLVNGQNLVSTFGASGSKAKFTGATSVGSKTLTLAAGSVNDFEVGHGILITSAAAGADLVTKVDAVSGLVITLHDAAGSTRPSTNVQHDDTVAIQTGIDTICAAGSGTLLFPPGFYRVNGPFNAIGSLLKVPANELSGFSGPGVAAKTLALVGTDINMIGWWGPGQTTGCIIQTDKVGATSEYALIKWDSPGATGNNTNAIINNLTFRTYPNPQISVLDLGFATCHTFVENVCIDANISVQDTTLPAPTHTGYFGIRTASNNLSTMNTLYNVEVNNHNIGFVLGENIHIVNATADRCMTGILFDAAYHLATGRFLICRCPTGVEFPASGIPRLVGLLIDFEQASGVGWEDALPGRTFYDPSDIAYGKIEYNIIRTFSGALLDASVTGCTHLTRVNLGLGTTAGPPL